MQTAKTLREEKKIIEDLSDEKKLRSAAETQNTNATLNYNNKRSTGAFHDPSYVSKSERKALKNKEAHEKRMLETTGELAPSNIFASKTCGGTGGTSHKFKDVNMLDWATPNTTVVETSKSIDKAKNILSSAKGN